MYCGAAFTGSRGEAARKEVASVGFAQQNCLHLKALDF